MSIPDAAFSVPHVACEREGPVRNGKDRNAPVCTHNDKGRL